MKSNNTKLLSLPTELHKIIIDFAIPANKHYTYVHEIANGGIFGVCKLLEKLEGKILKESAQRVDQS